MIAVGGITPNIDESIETADPWPQGLGIFDLTEMAWKSSYDAAAGPYETPKQVKDYIAANGQYPQAWNNDLTEQWITGRQGTLDSPRSM